MRSENTYEHTSLETRFALQIFIDADLRSCDCDDCQRRRGSIAATLLNYRDALFEMFLMKTPEDRQLDAIHAKLDAIYSTIRSVPPAVREMSPSRS